MKMLSSHHYAKNIKNKILLVNAILFFIYKFEAVKLNYKIIIKRNLAYFGMNMLYCSRFVRTLLELLLTKCSLNFRLIFLKIFLK